MSDTNLPISSCKPPSAAPLDPASPKPRGRLGNGVDAASRSLRDAAVAHVDRIKNNIGITRPYYDFHLCGPRDLNIPLVQLDKSAIQTLAAEARATPHFEKALAVLNKKLVGKQFWLNVLPNWLFSGIKNRLANDAHVLSEKITEIQGCIDNLGDICDNIEEFTQKLDELRAERMKGVPEDKRERDAFLTGLEDRELCLYHLLSDSRDLIKETVKTVQDINTGYLLNLKIFKSVLFSEIADARLLTDVPFGSRQADGSGLNAGAKSLEHALHRTYQLKQAVAAFEKAHGEEAARDFFAGGQVSASVALQALRSGETLSPSLRNALVDPNRIKDINYLGQGSFNIVSRAKLNDDNGLWRDYVLKPLDSRTKTPEGYSDKAGHYNRQVGVFGRQYAGAVLSEAMDLGVAGRPKYVLMGDKLHMAAPMIGGVTMRRAREAIQGAIMRGGNPRTMEDLHANASFQAAMQKLQLFHALAGNLDTHDYNMNIQFFMKQGGRPVEISPADVPLLRSDQIRMLDVRAGAFDLDLAFRAANKIEVTPFADNKGKITNPKASFTRDYMGVPHWHTLSQYNNLLEFRDSLDRETGADLENYLTSGEESHPRGGNKLNELSGLKARVHLMIDVFEEQARSGRRLNENGHMLDERGDVVLKEDMRTKLNDAVGYVISTRNPDEAVKLSIAHSYFPKNFSRMPRNAFNYGKGTIR